MMKDLIDIKIGDKDSLGRVITKIFIRSTQFRTVQLLRAVSNSDEEEKLEEVKYLVYETDDGELRYDALNTFAKKLVTYIEPLQNIMTLLQVEPSLRKKYHKILATVLRSVFESTEEDYIEFFEELKQKIKSNIFSIARLEYLKRYMILLVYAGITVVFCLVLPELFATLTVPYVEYIYLAICGIIGGFFSVASKIDKQPIDPFLPRERSKLDVYVRFVIAGLSGILIYWFLQSGFIGIVKVVELQSTESNMFLPLSIAVISGFSERIIPAIITTKEEEYFESIKKHTN